MKRCASCQQEKAEVEFHRNKARKDGRASQCKPCKKDVQARWYAQNRVSHVAKVRQRSRLTIEKGREWQFKKLSENPCPCGESNPLHLEFDHVRGEKRMAISRMVSTGYSVETLEKEYMKCQILCVKCHRLKTAKEGGHWMYQRVVSSDG